MKLVEFFQFVNLDKRSCREMIGSIRFSKDAFEVFDIKKDLRFDK